MKMETMERKAMNICVLCSTHEANNRVICGKIEDTFAASAEVWHPFKEPVVTETGITPLIDIMKDYIGRVLSSDLVVVIPKEVEVSKNASHNRETLSFGESVSYEMALAKVHKIPVLIWQ